VATGRPTRHIIAIGGFSKEVDPAPLDQYVLAQARRSRPSICFLGTASGDAESYIQKFYAAFGRQSCQPTHVPLFGRTPDLKRVLPAQDLIYVGGGNTKSMLATWREWGVPALLRRAWMGGTVLAGFSAGAICWFETGVTDSWADRLAALPCLGFLPDAACPHYDSEADRRPAVHRLVSARQLPATLALDDGVAAHFVGRRLFRVVTSRPSAGAYEIRRTGSRSVERPLPVDGHLSAQR